MKIKKEYIPMAKKREIANQVLMMSMDSLNGFIKIDLFKKRIYTFVFAAEEYMGAKFSDDFDEILAKYDSLVKSEDVKNITEMSDYAVLCDIVDDVISMVEKDNSVEHSVMQMSNEIASAFSRIASSLEDKINEFDMDILQDANIMELMSIVQKFK